MEENVIALSEEISQLLREKQFNQARSRMLEMNEVDIAGLFEELADGQLLLMYRLLPKELAAQAFAYLESDTQEKLLRLFTDRELATVMEELYIDDAADLLEEMPANVAKRILAAATGETRAKINELSQNVNVLVLKSLRVYDRPLLLILWKTIAISADCYVAS